MPVVASRSPSTRSSRTCRAAGESSSTATTARTSLHSASSRTSGFPRCGRRTSSIVFSAGLMVEATNRMGILAEVATRIAGEQSNISHVNTRFLAGRPLHDPVRGPGPRPRAPRALDPRDPRHAGRHESRAKPGLTAAAPRELRELYCGRGGSGRDPKGQPHNRRDPCGRCRRLQPADGRRRSRHARRARDPAHDFRHQVREFDDRVFGSVGDSLMAPVLERGACGGVRKAIQAAFATRTRRFPRQADAASHRGQSRRRDENEDGSPATQ